MLEHKHHLLYNFPKQEKFEGFLLKTIGPYCKRFCRNVLKLGTHRFVLEDWLLQSLQDRNMEVYFPMRFIVPWDAFWQWLDNMFLWVKKYLPFDCGVICNNHTESAVNETNSCYNTSWVDLLFSIKLISCQWRELKERWPWVEKFFDSFSDDKFACFMKFI